MYKSYKEHRDAGRYTLIYFNGKGRAETIRMLFEASGTQYEDKRVAREDWPELKPTTPFGELPVLEVAGTALGQSGSIARYVSKQVGLEGSTPLEQASTDAICDIVTDIRERAVKVRFTKDPEQQEAAMASFVEYYPKMFGCLERMLESNNGGHEFFVGSSLTRADIHFYAAVELLQTLIPGIITEKPLLVKLFDRVQSQENIAEYLKRRPVTEF